MLVNHNVVVRSKKASRIYYGTFAVIFFVLFLVSAISLGSFGAIQKKASDFNFGAGSVSIGSRCILFARNAGEETVDDRTIIHLHFPGIGACAYTLWGQVSILIVAFIWLVYTVALVGIGLRVLSLLRILDFGVFFLTFLFSFSLSITLSTGVRTTCGAFGVARCPGARLVDIDNPTSGESVSFYTNLHTAETSSWVATLMLLGLTVWNLILMIIYLKHGRKRREEDLTRLQDPPSGDVSPAESIEELTNVAESSEKKHNLM